MPLDHQLLDRRTIRERGGRIGERNVGLLRGLTPGPEEAIIENDHELGIIRVRSASGNLKHGYAWLVYRWFCVKRGRALRDAKRCVIILNLGARFQASRCYVVLSSLFSASRSISTISSSVLRLIPIV